MPHYLKAYRLGQLRSFPQWQPRAPEQNAHALSDDTVVFLHEDLRVTLNCCDDRDVLFDQVSPAWRTYCRDTLAFAVPDWDTEADAVRKALGES